MKREVKLFDELDRFAGGGEITHALALSFGYDGDTAAERIWTPLIEKYGVRHPLVIASGVIDEGTALGVHVLRMPRKSGVFHPKLFVAVREDAVFTAIGSANLTRGGLGGNLELLTPLVFARDAERPAPPSVLDAILGFVEGIADGLRGRIEEDSRGKVIDVIHVARIVRETLPEPRRAPDLRFLHSSVEPLWKQVVAMHGDDAVTHIAVVSPFFENDEPAVDEADSLLRHALGDGLPWAPRAKAPRCTLHVGALGSVMGLPRMALEELGGAVQLRPQALSVEPRRLHGKLLAIFGRKRTTLLWGSPNFTPSALLRASSEGGNVECALALTMGAAQVTPEGLIEEFDLGDVFHEHHGPLPEARPISHQALPSFEIGEALYDGSTRTLAVSGEAWSISLSRLLVFVDLGSGTLTLADEIMNGPGPFRIEVDARHLEEMDPETGKRRLRTLTLCFKALDASGNALGESRARINVRFEDALELRNNLLLGAEALTADALLVPSSAPPETRVAALDGLISLWKAAHRGERTAVVRHQASLDGFFRNVRRGLDARWEGLERRRGSRFALLRWSHDLRRSLASAANSAAMAPVRRTYLVARIAEHVELVLESIPRWHAEAAPAYAVLAPEKLADALGSVSVTSGVTLGIVDEAAAARARAVARLRVLHGTSVTARKRA